ncbi:MAG: glycosyltransferase family 4 protein [Xenococcaceae cyanobacterium MO_188.B32]|nr:glycosyltransferase family 4 protein [Xenococcaceae cyanobacterium MO_188.B32]
MDKLIVLPSWCSSLGGTTVSLSMMVRGFEQCSASENLCVLVQSGSLMEDYLQHLGYGDCLQSIAASDQRQFFKLAFRWVSKQNRHFPLLLENCASRYLLPTLALAAPALRFSGRPVYHVFRDLAHSYNPLGNLFRKFVFTCLSPGAICNSQFTAQAIGKHLIPEIKGILYPPVDRERFSPRPAPNSPPPGLQPILDSGAKIMLTPARISQPKQMNDKNLRGLIIVLAKLKELGYHYHGVIIGQDHSPGKLQTRTLLELAQQLAVSERLTILPSTFAIEDYYQYADVLVTLAPREPFGRTVVEAIACGVPVVGSNTGGIGEILSNFAPQWIVDPYKPMAVAQTIISLARDPNTSSVLARGQKWVESYCSPVEYAKKIMQIVNLDSS